MVNMVQLVHMVQMGHSMVQPAGIAMVNLIHILHIAGTYMVAIAGGYYGLVRACTQKSSAIAS